MAIPVKIGSSGKPKTFNSKTNFLFVASVGFFFGVSFCYSFIYLHWASPEVQSSNVECPEAKCPNIACPIIECPKMEFPKMECPSIECPVCSFSTPEKSKEELIQQNCKENDNKAEHGFVEETESIDFKE